MKGIRQILLVSIIFLGTSPRVFADPFIEGSEDASSRFHGHLDDFSRALGESGQRMRESYDYSANQQSQRNLADQMAIQQGTQALSQQEFQKGLVQAQANTSSGGFVNNGGLFGSGIGAFGIGVPQTNVAAGASAAYPTAAYPVQRGVVYVPVPVVAVPSQGQSSHGGLFSDDLFGSSASAQTTGAATTATEPNWRAPVPVPVTTLHKHSIPGYSSSSAAASPGSTSSSQSPSFTIK